MEITITATDAVKEFSEILNNIKYVGTNYIIQRNGKALARLSPLTQGSMTRTLAELASMLAQLPPLGDEAEAFKRDLIEIANQQPALPQGQPWA
jgi:antitoxin (DNA-binding transcriptional repressor) of toxin-antitoxin stability system